MRKANVKIEYFETRIRTIMPVDFITDISLDVIDEQKMIFFDRTHNAVLVQKFDHAVLYHNNFDCHLKAKREQRRSTIFTKTNNMGRCWKLLAGMARPIEHGRLPGDQLFILSR